MQRNVFSSSSKNKCWRRVQLALTPIGLGPKLKRIQHLKPTYDSINGIHVAEISSRQNVRASCLVSFYCSALVLGRQQTSEFDFMGQNSLSFYALYLCPLRSVYFHLLLVECQCMRVVNAIFAS